MCYNKNFQRKFDEKLKGRFFNIYKFSKHGNKKIILLLGKGVYTCEYVDDWEKFSRTLLPEKEEYYSHLNMEDITDADYVRLRTLLLADVFDKFRNMCLEIYELHPEKSDSAPELAWEPSLKKTKVKLDLLTGIDMLLMLKKVSEEEYVILFIDIKKLITNN